MIEIAPADMNMFCSFDNQAISKQNHNLTNISPCTQEKGDTRVFLHVQDAARHGSSKIKIRTVDTDVVVIGICLYGSIAGVEELWIDFGVGKNRRYYPIQDITATFDELKCKALDFFHAFTGCDQVSFFSQCGKTKA